MAALAAANVEAVSTGERSVSTGVDGLFHARMALAILAFAVLSFGACLLGDIQMPGLASSYVVPLLFIVMLLPLPICWLQTHRLGYVDASLILLWAWCEDDIIPYMVRATVRLRMPLADNWLGHMDQHLGVSVPAIMQWSEHHRIGHLITGTYSWATGFLLAAVVIPILFQQRIAAKRLLVANLSAFLMCVPFYALMPAVGPWHFYQFPFSASSRYISEPVLYALRQPGPYVLRDQMAGVITFPSFHVVWAILCAATFWNIRWLRLPSCLLAAMICCSTLTTGWHYFTDVLGGLIVATVALLIARMLLRTPDLETVMSRSEVCRSDQTRLMQFQ